MNAKKISSELKESIKKILPGEPYQVILFGSVARGKSSDDSDIDILIILNTGIDLKIKDIIYEICSSLNIKYDVWIDVSLISLSEMNTIRGRQPYIQNAIREGIIL